MSYKKATLILQNGQKFQGWSFGYEAEANGEIVFSTAMVGYPESLTDPSYSGQILCVSYPLIGNYGIPATTCDKWGLSANFESEKIQVKALVILSYSENYSHWDAEKSLGDWLKEEKIPAIFGIDTRHLTQIIREEGTMTARIVIADSVITRNVSDEVISLGAGIASGTSHPRNDDTPSPENQVSLVSCKEPIHYTNGKKKVVLLDCGVKHHILRDLINKEVEVIRVPWDYDFNQIEWNGLFISNGPGDPSLCEPTIQHIREALKTEKPILGIGMGHQLLAIASGAKTYKLKYGHHSLNQPVRIVGTNNCIITNQNHGYAVDANTLPEDWKAIFENMNDGTNEGMRHKSLPYLSAQFYADSLLNDFISEL